MKKFASRSYVYHLKTDIIEIVCCIWLGAIQNIIRIAKHAALILAVFGTNKKYKMWLDEQKLCVEISSFVHFLFIVHNGVEQMNSIIWSQ